eukprot:TRINITY_DN43419_c0_g1_i1.p1 TRINITY_DN43419_c0_g1~~TRINITY_DN43419_c0_g1_i1.p1  ORF type:complete len:406 (+),score=61.28 TRINITY_DN43419_c0_g1_i1:117-1220(+)
MPTDLLQWKQVNRGRRAATQQARDTILQAKEHFLNKKTGQQADGALFELSRTKYTTDLIPISLTQLGYSLPSGKILFKLDSQMAVQQGRLVAVQGEHGSGKSTLLRLLAHELFPTEGSIFIPSHLRILHVSQEVLLVKESVWRNLVFGCALPLSDVDVERIALIAEQLGIGPKMMELIHDDVENNSQMAQQGSGDQVQDDTRDSSCPSVKSLLLNQEGSNDKKEQPSLPTWQRELTYTEKVKLHFARAFLMNPEVMVLQRPCHHFAAGESHRILKLLRDHTDSRGVGMPQQSVAQRRPRTVFFTPEMDSQADLTDVIWEICCVDGSKSNTIIEKIPEGGRSTIVEAQDSHNWMSKMLFGCQAVDRTA